MKADFFTRRAFLHGSTLILAGSALSRGSLLADDATAKPKLRIGLFTDVLPRVGCDGRMRHVNTCG